MSLKIKGSGMILIIFGFVFIVYLFEWGFKIVFFLFLIDDVLLVVFYGNCF